MFIGYYGVFLLYQYEVSIGMQYVNMSIGYSLKVLIINQILTWFENMNSNQT